MLNKVILTGAAGFIGYHVSKRLLDAGTTVVGIDIVNDYYDPTLKESRLQILQNSPEFSFHRVDIADTNGIERVFAKHQDATHIVHLAAQAGVRYSLTNPLAYTHSNITGQVVMLEAARKLPNCRHFVYASSSSVYGANTKLPFSVGDAVDHPVSLYAATKRSCELLAHTYSHLYALRTTGLRFFTVYGPWGRPDMSPFLFVRAICEGKPIRVFNNGDMRRDFTYIDDIVEGVLRVAQSSPLPGQSPYRLYNIGNHRSEALLDFIKVIEESLGRKATLNMEPMQPGDVKETFADVTPLSQELGFQSNTTIYQGIPRFVEWYRNYYTV
jgi:UDP-glucuronate 4-epimerase